MTLGACLTKNGIAATNLSQMRALVDTLPKRRPGTRPSAAERQQAITDATCQEQAGLRAAIDQAVLTAASPWLAAHEAEVLGLTEVIADGKKRAARVIAGGAL